MAANSRVSAELLIRKKWHEREISTSPNRIVPLIYYLSRNGHLDHPHFIEVPLSPSQGLYLRDVMNRLNFLRGKGMANMYSWSSKRSYKNGYVWQDLSEDDLIHPTNGHEYVLKGSELLQSSQSFRSYATASSQNIPATNFSSEDCNFPATIRRRNQSWSSSSIDNPQEYRVYKAESSRDLAGKFADAATQTGEKGRRRLVRGESEEHDNQTVELSREELSPPPSNSSSEVLEGVSGSRDVDRSASIRDRTVDGRHPSGRMKASLVMKQLITCGSFSVDDIGSTKSK